MPDTVTLDRASVNALVVHAEIALSLIQRYDDVLKGSESQMTRAILPDVIKKVRDVLRGEALTDELLLRGESGSPAALDILESMYPTLSHDSDCSYRCKGECDCTKSRIVEILTRHNREVA